MKKAIALSLALLMLVALLAGCKDDVADPNPSSDSSTYADTAVYTEVNETVYAKTNVHIRELPSKDSTSITVLQAGQSIVRTGYNDDWSKVIYNSKTYYIATDYLTRDAGSVVTTQQSTGTAVPESDFTTCPETVVYIRSTSSGTYYPDGQSSLRNEPNFGADSVKVINNGTAVKKIATSSPDSDGDYWLKIIYEDTTYYIFSTQISDTDPTQTTQAS